MLLHYFFDDLSLLKSAVRKKVLFCSGAAKQTCAHFNDQHYNQLVTEKHSQKKCTLASVHWGTNAWRNYHKRRHIYLLPLCNLCPSLPTMSVNVVFKSRKSFFNGKKISIWGWGIYDVWTELYDKWMKELLKEMSQLLLSLILVFNSFFSM